MVADLFGVQVLSFPWEIPLFSIDFWNVQWAISPLVPWRLVAHFVRTGLILVKCNWNKTWMNKLITRSKWNKTLVRSTQLGNSNILNKIPIWVHNYAISGANPRHGTHLACQYLVWVYRHTNLLQMSWLRCPGSQVWHPHICYLHGFIGYCIVY